jgi:hypothetical protein
MNKELPRKSSRDLTLTQHHRDEHFEPQEMCLHLEVEHIRAWYYKKISNSRTFMILLQVNPTFGNEFETIYECFYETKNTSIFSWFNSLTTS